MLREKPPAGTTADAPHEGNGSRRPLHILLTSVSSDSHTWNLVFMQLLIQHLGHRVTNLGACTPDEEVVQTCLDLSPDLLVVSTVNGLGNIDGERLIRRIREDARLQPLPAVIGGKLGIRGEHNRSFTRDLLKAGYSAVFTDDTALAGFGAFLAQMRADAGADRLLEASA